MEEKKNRLAELAAEMVMAKNLADVFATVWAEASPAAKQKIADATMAEVTRLITGDTYSYANIARHFIGEAAKVAAQAQVAARAADIEATMQKAVDQVISAELATKLESALRDALRGADRDRTHASLAARLRAAADSLERGR